MTLQPILKSKSQTNSNQTISDSSSISIPSNIEQQLSRLGIPLENRVKNAIASHHNSQVIGALNHVEANYELIQSPTAVFLYQLPRQPIIENKPLLPVYTAASFSGYTIEHMKAWYPNRWQEAAKHFGIPLTSAPV